MRISAGRKLSDFIVAIYVIGTLFLRFLIEPQLQGNMILSLGLGLFALLFLWALIKSKVLQPGILDMGSRVGQRKG